MNKKDLIERMTNHLENMCAYHATGDMQLFHYYAGKAEAIRDLLDDFYNWDDDSASEHIKNMWEIMDEHW